jgi:hypothetical protein
MNQQAATMATECRVYVTSTILQAKPSRDDRACILGRGSEHSIVSLITRQLIHWTFDFGTSLNEL